MNFVVPSKLGLEVSSAPGMLGGGTFARIAWAILLILVVSIVFSVPEGYGVFVAGLMGHAVLQEICVRPVPSGLPVLGS